MTHYDFDNRTRWRRCATLEQCLFGGAWLLTLWPDGSSTACDAYAFRSKAKAQRLARELLGVPRIHWRLLNGDLQGFYLLRHELGRRRQLRLVS